MDREFYREIHSCLDSFDDVERVSRDFGLPVGVVTSILDQKTVGKVKKVHSRVSRQSAAHLRAWKKGKSMISIARKNRIPATLMVSMILKEMGCPEKKMVRDPELIVDKRLKLEVKEALKNDLFFSPAAHRMQAVKGEMGELLIAKWLKKKDICHRNEDDLRREGLSKTPDFLLDEAIEVDGTKISWIESKAMFADEDEYSRHLKKQFRPYEERFGRGMVVYWYGFLDSISIGNIMIKDHSFFSEISDDVKSFLEMDFKH